MTTTTTLPLPLELTQPNRQISDAEALIREMFATESAQYNPETQMREGSLEPVFGDQTDTNSKCTNNGVLQVDDVLQDIITLEL